MSSFCTNFLANLLEFHFFTTVEGKAAEAGPTEASRAAKPKVITREMKESSDEKGGSSASVALQQPTSPTSPGLLHSGPMLGDLPSLPTNSSINSATKKQPSPADKKHTGGSFSADMDAALGYTDPHRSPSHVP